MSNDDSEHLFAQRLVRSLLQRLVPDERGNYVFHGPVSADDRAALALLAGAPAASPEIKTPVVTTPTKPKHRFRAPATVPEDCALDNLATTVASDTEDVVAIDFGTAYSKSALWRAQSDAPTPLDLSGQVSDRPGSLLPSSLYITDGAVYFGQLAIDISRWENDPDRMRFDSPKQELSILEGSDLDSLVDARVDPGRQLTNRDLLTLYLAYLSAATSLALETLSLSRHIVRRFAVPVWKDGQVVKVSKLLKRLLVDAQILADSLPAEVWRDGISLDDAQRVLRMLRGDLTDAQRDAARLVDRHVLEAAAAAAAIGDRLANKRPTALVVDIGAGTTDLGLYRFTIPNERQASIFPFANGGAALKIAGNRLDDLLIDFIKAQARLDAEGGDGQRSLNRIRRDIRDHKITLFESGTLEIEDIGDTSITLAGFLATDGVRQFKEKLKADIEALIGAVGIDNLNLSDGLYVVLTGGGAKVSIFTDVFKSPITVQGQSFQLKPIDVTPEWLEDYDIATQQIFPQLAVAVGACSPSLPDEKTTITDAAVALPRRVERYN
ncbi:hypothetical protein [Caulobacter sp. UNC358MFTsu5.1]|uniref:hypothetical protein n=1 Tax=Caulobacter sp. UNC358MFTsu5.1 TaxID=1449049 RepID=UPI000AE58216|nr:hypothetical protein [Caulobacter sp. UNC358MFTsu5.1]